ncbi:MAG: DUF2911 domain-containing protein [Acidobacteriota bacterium]|nr:DUF2911 domain-containing protein [Acidobacteriota bacterium]
MLVSSLRTLACTLLFAAPVVAQMPSAPAGKPLSPPASATVSLSGQEVSICYSAPSMRGRTIMGGLVPYGEVWRTGANAATTLVTKADLTIGGLAVPAGTYTLYSLPSADKWLLIVNKQTGQWGTVYNQAQDLGRIPMVHRDLRPTQELMSISFENTHGNATELHVRWENTDEYVKVTAK